MEIIVLFQGNLYSVSRKGARKIGVYTGKEEYAYEGPIHMIKTSWRKTGKPISKYFFDPVSEKTFISRNRKSSVRPKVPLSYEEQMFRHNLKLRKAENNKINRFRKESNKQIKQFHNDI
jgi:hypothetical protein